MIIKKLKSEDMVKYYVAIRDLMVEIYMINFQIQYEQAEEVCENKLQLLKSYINNDSAIVIAAIENDELIGFTWLYIHDFLGKKRLHVNQIAVNSNSRGKGIGKRIIQEVEKQAIINDITIIDLFVSEVNTGALNLYNHLGFNTERRYMKKEL